jgi:transposase
MKKYISKRPEMCIGLDLGDRSSYFKVLDSEGELIEEGKVMTKSGAMQKKFGSLTGSRIALEAGTHSGWVSRLLESLGHEVLVANPRKLRLIYQNKRKDDRVDAEYLARVALLDPELLSPIQLRGEEAQKDLLVIRARNDLVEARTKLINLVRAAVKQMGSRVRKCSAPVFAAKATQDMPEQLRAVLEPVVKMIQELTEKIGGYDATILQWCEEKYPETGAVRQIRGVGPVTALTFVLTLEDPGRFRKSRSVGPYLGLCPGRGQSGDNDPQRRITREGNPYLRKLLIQCAHYIMGRYGIDSDLRRHGEKIALRGGKNAKKRAMVAVARKLAVVMHRLWVTGEVYEPLYNHRDQEAA